MPTNHQKLEDPRPAGLVSRRSTGKYLPGLLASAVAVTVALIIHSFIPAIPAMTCAVILGLLVANLPRIQPVTRGILRPGLNFSGKHLMRAGIVVLGLKLSIGDVVRLGWATFGIVVAVVVLAFVGTFLLGKLFRLPGDSPLLIATGFSICGASAIGAMAAARRVRQEDTVLPIALVTLCGTLAIGVLPLLMTPLRLTRTGFGLWVGASVHDVGQVVATAQVAGTTALTAALIIKLTRVLLLAPIVSGAAILSRRHQRSLGVVADDGTKLPPVIPLFILGFVLMIAVRSLGWLNGDELGLGSLIQDILLGSALFGLGSAVRIRELARTGARAGLLALCSWLLIAALGYGAVQLIQIQ